MDEAPMVALALQQHGLITRDQARNLGATPAAIDGRLSRGSWTSARRGVYAIGAAPPTWERGAMAACLAGGPDVVGAARTAARVWGLVDRSGPLQVLVAGRRRVRLERVTTHRTLLLPSIDRAVVRGIPVTSLARTLVDVSAGQDAAVVGQWIDQAIRDHGLSILELESCLARLAGPGRRDTAAIRTALTKRPAGYDPGESSLEARVIQLLDAAGFPPPVLQHPVRRGDGRTARIDVCYPWAKVALEPEGFQFHSDRTAFDRDRVRGAELTLLGWDVYRLTSAMSDQYIARTVAAALDLAVEKLGLPSWRGLGSNLGQLSAQDQLK